MTSRKAQGVNRTSSGGSILKSRSAPNRVNIAGRFTTRTKLHIDESAAAELQLVGAGLKIDARAAELAKEIAKYTAETPALQAKAKAFEAKYDALNVHDDQFDVADAMMATAVSAAAVSSVVDIFAVLAVAWVFGAFGIVMGLAGFVGWTIHPAFLASFLG